MSLTKEKLLQQQYYFLEKQNNDSQQWLEQTLKAIKDEKILLQQLLIENQNKEEDLECKIRSLTKTILCLEKQNNQLQQYLQEYHDQQTLIKFENKEKDLEDKIKSLTQIIKFLKKQKVTKSWKITFLNIITFGFFKYHWNKKIIKEINEIQINLKQLSVEKSEITKNINKILKKLLNNSEKSNIVDQVKISQIFFQVSSTVLDLSYRMFKLRSDSSSLNNSSIYNIDVENNDSLKLETATATEVISVPKENDDDDGIEVISESEENDDDSIEVISESEENDDDSIEVISESEENDDDSIEVISESEENDDDSIEVISESEENDDSIETNFDINSKSWVNSCYLSHSPSTTVNKGLLLN